MRQNLSIHLGFIYNFHRAPFLALFLTVVRWKAPESGFAPRPYAFVRRSSHPLFPPFGNSKGELNTVWPPPHPSALPYSTFLCFLSLLFDVKSDSNIYSSVNQRRFLCLFSPVLCTNLILFPEMPYQSKEKNLFLSFFLPCFIWKGGNAKCN